MKYRDVYVVQPYEVGTKDRKSLAIIIPAGIAKEYSFNTSTIFALKADKTKKLTLRTVNTTEGEDEEKMIPAGESFAASSQPASYRRAR